MTDSVDAMTAPAKQRSRRALLAGALGGLGAWVASSVGRATPVRAEGETMVVGGEYDTATSRTFLENSTNDDTVFMAASLNGGVGVWGYSQTDVAIRGESVDGTGVFGSGGSGDGVVGTTTTGRGVVGTTSATTGVQGTADTGTGVHGAATSGLGVGGESETGTGVYGLSPAGVGIRGGSDTGWAGYFDGSVFTRRYVEFREMATPPRPDRNRARLFVRDRGGRTQLCVRFANGTVRVLASS